MEYLATVSASNINQSCLSVTLSVFLIINYSFFFLSLTPYMKTPTLVHKLDNIWLFCQCIDQQLVLVLWQWYADGTTSWLCVCITTVTSVSRFVGWLDLGSPQPVLFLSVCAFKQVRRSHAAVFTFNVWIFRHQAVMHALVATDLHGFKWVDCVSGRCVTVLAPSRYISATKAEVCTWMSIFCVWRHMPWSDMTLCQLFKELQRFFKGKRFLFQSPYRNVGS